MGVAIRMRVPLWASFSIRALGVQAAGVVKQVLLSEASIQKPVDLYCSESGGCGAYGSP